MFDVIIRRGLIYDGSGGPPFESDIGIVNDTISFMGDLSDRDARLEIDAEGKAVSPGFIDIHTHSDLPLLQDGAADSHIRQGVTTNVIGNCGNSAAPVTDEAISYMKEKRASDLCVEWDWNSLDEYLMRLESSGVSVNVVPLVGQGTIRGSVMGFSDRPPSEDEMNKMQEMLRGALCDGAFGLSTGLIYVPGSYADTEELVELCSVLSEFDALYASHIRGENDTLLDAIQEALYIGEKSEVPVQISHLKAMGRHMWGTGVRALQMIERARTVDGIQVTADQYPYNASATGLGAYLPPWAHIGGTEELMRRLRDDSVRQKIKEAILNEEDDEWISLYKGVGWENTLITRCPDEDLEGRSIDDIARDRGVDPFDCAFDILLESEGQVGVVYFTIGDEDLESIMQHSCVMIGSDSSAVSTEGPLAKGKPHPRAFGTYSRVLGKYAREEGVISLSEAIRKMTALPAQTLGISDRGFIRPQMKADIVVFDAKEVQDKATYTDPFQYPVGVRHVLVNGNETVREGKHLGARSGMIMRRNH